MEKWESNLRFRLDEELEPGPYTVINNKEMVLVTGKLGWIEYAVAMQRELIKRGLKIKDEEGI